MEMDEKRRFLRHAFAMLTFSFVLGLVAGALGGQHHPNARIWMGAHVTGILTGLLLIGLGVVRPSLRLGPRAGRAFFAAAVGGNWFAMLLFGIFGSLAGVPGAITTPNLPPAAPWQSTIIGIGLVIVTLTTFTTCGLALYGLRARTPSRSADALAPPGYKAGVSASNDGLGEYEPGQPVGRALVGRQRELGELGRGLDEARGRGRLFLLAGEPGIGKTTLSADEASACGQSRRGLPVLWGRCWEAGGAPAYWPWLDVLAAPRAGSMHRGARRGARRRGRSRGRGAAGGAGAVRHVASAVVPPTSTERASGCGAWPWRCSEGPRAPRA